MESYRNIYLVHLVDTDMLIKGKFCSLSIVRILRKRGTIIVRLNSRKQTRGFPADWSELILLFSRSYDRQPTEQA